MGDPVLRFKDTESVGQVYFDIGSSNLIGGNYAEARRTFEELLLMKKTDNPMAESAALSYIALANMLEGNWNRAITEFEKAVELREKLRQPTHNLEYLIALCRAAKGEGDKAVPLLTKVGGAEASARLALVEGRLEKAVQLFQKAASDAEERKNSLIMISALTGLGEAYEKMGDKAKAAEAYTKAVDLLQGPDFVSPFDRRDRMIRLLFAGFAPGAPKAALERLKN
jgi:tetratricopeptide (TPR) repeat protein